MKDLHDDKTLDWIGIPKGHVAIFERMLTVLLVIKETPIATNAEVQKVINVSTRTAQRYTSQLESAGYIKRKSCAYWDEHRFFLTDKAKKLFQVAL
ncbi:DNA-binding MarR family transcriptional regulator [Acinetobacter bereziniae]|uniref:winged helix-turn-helix transcriptional regulator n=1 Tax=Acinetobacter bereziniae TaxID=106648 RepID=UPI0028623B63|nr:winged helix-turn-helix transcriptional regulator [Acinetobacter bereziniae]MDR6542942.1 DNA-binding MarR family transcriptional regulator [Acinetobacter bereziniae]